MRAQVVVRTPDGRRVALAPGELIGRAHTAALVIDHPGVSEAHALVSQRHGQLLLLSLRRLLAVDGHPQSEVVLEPGLVVQLATDVALVVEEVARPALVMALEIAGVGVRVLGSVASLHADTPLRVSARFDPEAAAHIWHADGRWRARVGAGLVVSIAAGDVLEVGDEKVRVVEIAGEDAENHSTDAAGALVEPLRLIARFSGVEIHRKARPVCTLGGVSARILSELVLLQGPADWEVIAREIWRDEQTREGLRDRWDAALRRLRVKLRSEGVRSDLVRADGTGSFTLVLYEGDSVEDQT